MGLDVYVGSLTRYHAGDWETVIQRHARETGMALNVVRANEPEDIVTDQNTIRAAVLAWRDNLTIALGDNIDGPLNWDESPDSAYFTDKPAWDCYSSLLLWAAYLEHPDLVRPAACVEDWTRDEAFKRSIGTNFQSEYPALLTNTEVWLPANFRFTFAAPDVSGNKVKFGSSLALRDELADINARTWRADSATLAAWRREGADYLAPLERGARFAFAIFSDLANKAAEHRLVMKLDY
jgi:hypothetical protein